MKREFTEYTCDECDKKETELNSKGYPYHKGWKYILNFQYKDSIKIQSPHADKHFCCKKCIIKYLNKLFTPKRNGKK